MNYEYNRIIDESASMIDHRKFSTPVFNPMVPTREEYTMGRFTRYFAISEIDDRIIEIDDKQFRLVPNPNKGISPHIWKPVKIKWKLKGPRFDISKNGVLQKKGVTDVNKNTISNIAKSNPKILRAIRDYTYLATIEQEVKNNLMAVSGELVYASNPSIEYTGLYHIHPSKGPMQGPKHVSESHQLLQYITDKPGYTGTKGESPAIPVTNTTTSNNTSSGGSSGGY